jgi:hypothetical protein
MNETIALSPASHAKRSAERAVEASGLPDSAAQLILRVTRKTRLWRREQADVAVDLIAHFKDGLYAGRSVDDLVQSFGSPELAARLIRRGKRRNRPLWYRSMRQLVLGSTAIALAYAAAALLLATRQPRVSVDYVTELNGLLPAAAANERAWPVYRAALVPKGVRQLDDIFTPFGRDAAGEPVGPMPLELRPQDADWPKAVALLRAHGPLLAAAREGGRKRVYGLPLLPADQYSEQDRQALGLSSPEASGVGPLQSALWNDLRHDPLGPMAHLLLMDSRLAAADGDAARVAENYRATVGMAAQAAQRPTSFGLHNSAAIRNVADQAVAEIERSYPRLLDGHRVGLLHDMASATDSPVADLGGGRAFALDVIQRIYSDGGSGDGTLTYAGINSLLSGLVGPPGAARTPPWDERAISLASLPLAAAAGASRKETTEKVTQFYNAAEREINQPMWRRLRVPSETAGLLDDWGGTRLRRHRHFPIQFLLGSADSTAMRRGESRALHEATIAAVALSLWRERHGEYPVSLAELVPQYLPQLPVDHSSGEPLRYKIKDGRPVLYGVGRDGTDDGGVWLGDRRRWPAVPDQGDWLLYPPVSVP